MSFVSAADDFEAITADLDEASPVNLPDLVSEPVASRDRSLRQCTSTSVSLTLISVEFSVLQGRQIGGVARSEPVEWRQT
jgi:hypothetical protein